MNTGWVSEGFVGNSGVMMCKDVSPLEARVFTIFTEGCKSAAASWPALRDSRPLGSRLRVRSLLRLWPRTLLTNWCLCVSSRHALFRRQLTTCETSPLGYTSEYFRIPSALYVDCVGGIAKKEHGGAHRDRISESMELRGAKRRSVLWWTILVADSRILIILLLRNIASDSFEHIPVFSLELIIDHLFFQFSIWIISISSVSTTFMLR